MRGGEIPHVKIEIVLLLAVIGQRLAWNLSAGDTSTVGEYCKKEGIHAGTLLQHIEDSLASFIHKRNCSDLHTDHCGGVTAVCPEVGIAKAAPAPAVIFRNSRRFTSNFNPDYSCFLW
jgi:hypothetical protein